MRIPQAWKTLFPLLFALLLNVLGSCGPARSLHAKKELRHILDDPQREHYFSGLLVVDASSGKVLFNRHAAQYFTPASNIKILTLYAALKHLPERMPSIQYLDSAGIRYFRGMGDPSQLHPKFGDSTLVQLLTHKDSVVYVEDHFTDTPLGPGWAWEDFDAGFAPERSPLPLYGNVFSVYPGRESSAIPEIFQPFLSKELRPYRRLPEDNRFFIPERPDTVQVPYRTGTELTLNLLENLLQKNVGKALYFPSGEILEQSSIARDSMLREMMLESDNFLAEQLLLATAMQLRDTLDSRKAIRQVLQDDLDFLPQRPRWVDGSGLSRYNLMTPASLVSVLKKLYDEYPFPYLQRMFPAGGVSGTLADSYPGKEGPYLFAKSGTLSNNYNLSGYVRTKRGRLLIFSLMQNHFMQPQREIREGCRRLLEVMYQHY